MMIKVNTNDPVTSRAAEVWGERGQLNILLEECAEVIQAIAHYKRKRVGSAKIAEEIADVIVCFQSVIKVLNINKEVAKFIEYKTRRLECRMSQLQSRVERKEISFHDNPIPDIDDTQSSGGFTNE